MRTLLLLLAVAGACRKPVAQAVDADEDGALSDVDCDDGDALVFPGADETCNLSDDDCDGFVDEDPTDAATFWRDLDADGYGDLAFPRDACAAHHARGL